MKKWIFLILLFPLTCIAQTYQYIGVEDGLSNRRVYYIQKDRTGYMWFLTHEGIDNLYRSDVPIYWSGRWAKQPASLLYPERQNRIYVVPHP